MFLTFGVCDLTLPARASEPWTFPMIAVGAVTVSCALAAVIWRWDVLAADVLVSQFRGSKSVDMGAGFDV